MCYNCVVQEASGAADAARQEALDLRSQLTAAQATIKALQVSSDAQAGIGTVSDCTSHLHAGYLSWLAARSCTCKALTLLPASALDGYPDTVWVYCGYHMMCAGAVAAQGV